MKQRSKSNETHARERPQLVSLRVLLVSDDGQEYRLNPPFRENLQRALCASDKTPWQVCVSVVSYVRLLYRGGDDDCGTCCFGVVRVECQLCKVASVAYESAVVVVTAVAAGGRGGGAVVHSMAVFGARMFVCCFFFGPAVLPSLRVFVHYLWWSLHWLPAGLVREGSLLASLRDACQPSLHI